MGRPTMEAPIIVLEAIVWSWICLTYVGKPILCIVATIIAIGALSDAIDRRRH